MKGTVIKVISENFYVDIMGEVVICTERGKLKLKKSLPLVGDLVIVDKEKKVIQEILPRKNVLIRPNVANISQAFIITSLKNPDFSTNLLDKLIVQLEINKIKPVICITKKDLIGEEEFFRYQEILNYYKKIGYEVVFNHELLKIKKMLKNEITVFTGQTGAGKSSLLNKLFQELDLKTGEISLALGRGRHTTRHTEIITISDIKVLDTPGFSALSFLSYDLESVKKAFVEFDDFPCLYKDCNHIKELECMVKKAVNDGKILKSRYENYLNFAFEFLNRK